MDMNAAITQAFKLVKDGADIIDIGEKLTVCLIIIRYVVNRWIRYFTYSIRYLLSFVASLSKLIT